VVHQVWIPWSMLYVAAYEESKRRCERPASGARSPEAGLAAGVLPCVL